MENLFEIIESVADVIKVQEDISKSFLIPFDIESTGFDFKSDKLRLIQFKANETVYIMIPELLPERVIKYVLDLIKQSGRKLVGHNIKFDLKFIYENYGILFDNIHCTMISEYLITEARDKFASLQEVAFKYLGEILDKETVLEFTKDVPISQEMLIYGARDVAYLEEIRDMQMELIAEKKMEKVYQLEMDLVPVVTKIESNGVLIDYDGWVKLYNIAVENSDKFKQEIVEAFWKLCEETIVHSTEFVNVMDVLSYWDIPYKTTKKSIAELEQITVDQIALVREQFVTRLNLASPKQMKKAFQIMGAKVDSTAVKVLKSLAKKFPIAKLMLEFRKNYKRVTTYGMDFLANVREDGRIYAKFNQIGTNTGRFSSRKPNLQNIIAGSEYRKCFIAPKGKKLITADYSQQEFKLAGELSGEPAIIEAYLKGADMHTATGALLYHVPLEEVTTEQRKNGKTVNFAVLYGSSAYGLARTMGVTSEEAEEFLARFKEGFPRLARFQQDIQDLVWKLRYSVTPTGRRKGFKKESSWETSTDFYKFKGQIDREGFNHVVQGGSADMLKYALLLLEEENPWGERFKIIMTVHDEIVCEVDEELADEAKIFVQDMMIQAGNILMKQIPTEVDATISDYWSK